MRQISLQTNITSLGHPDFNVERYHDSLRLRKRNFVDERKWLLPTFNGMETDQYDSIYAHHITAHKGSHIVGTLRLLPTTHNLFGCTYMILDAHRGKFPNMPTGLLVQEIIDDEVWEASRLAISSDIPVSERNRVIQTLIHKASEFLKSNGAHSMLGLMNPGFVNIFNRMKFPTRQIGPTKDQLDGEICVLRYDF